MNNPKIKEPVVYKLELLPKFIQILVADMWETYNIKPEELEKHDLVFTYFDGIYTRHKMPTSLFVHESVHYIRQGGGEDELRAKEWWIRYCSDPEFRYQEELLAYREQYQYVLRETKNKQTSFNFAKQLAGDLCGPIYGNLRGLQTVLGDIIRKDDKKA